MATSFFGNFILRNYLASHGFGRVNKVVFTVPPFRGSIDIVTGVVIGEGWFPHVKSKIRKLIRAMPGALELLPTYEGASRFRPSSPKHSFFIFSHWQGNIIDPGNSVAEKMKKALKDARDTVENNKLLELPDLSAGERKRILVIARDGYETFQAIECLKNGPDGTVNLVDFEKALKTERGDGRVHPHRWRGARVSTPVPLESEGARCHYR